MVYMHSDSDLRQNKDCLAHETLRIVSYFVFEAICEHLPINDFICM